jgi:hypothetical protein
MAYYVNADSVKRRLKFEYLRVKNEHESKSLELFTQLLNHVHKPDLSVMNLIQEATLVIQKQFRFRWCMIGLREPDGWYRYLVNTGMREDAWARQKAKQYKLSDFDPNAVNYKAGEISKLSRVYLEEDNQLGKDDEGVVNRPALLHLTRKAEDDVLEADFLDTLIMGPGDELLGWIEYSGTVTGKMPDAMTIRHIEVISNILASAILLSRSRGHSA